MKTKHIDERIITTKHKFGYQTFLIMYTLIFIKFFMEVIMERPLLDIIMSGGIIIICTLYFSIRNVKAGVYTSSSNNKDLKRKKKKASLYALIGTVISLVLINIDHSHSDFLDPSFILANILIGMILYTFMYKLECYFINKSYKKSNEMIEEDL